MFKKSPNYTQQFFLKTLKNLNLLIIWIVHLLTWAQMSVGLSKTKGESLQPCGTETETVRLFIVLFIYQWQGSL